MTAKNGLYGEGERSVKHPKSASTQVGRDRSAPLVSIVTPTLNRVDLLEHTIKSVRNQSYGNLEHIVMDGGSTDRTLDALRRHEAAYNLQWTSLADLGMYHAINAGFRKASGEILAYLNSDDLYFPWTVETVVRNFQAHPKADFVFGDAIAIDDETGRHALNFQPPFDLDYVRRWGFLCQPTVFWRRSVFEQEGGFDESLQFVADCDYWMRLGARRQFHKINEFLAVERNHATTLREARAEVLWDELASVRSRYVLLHGPSHRLRVAGHRVRAVVWARAYWIRFAMQSLLARRSSCGPWSRLLNSGHPLIRWHLLPLRLIPGISNRRPRVVQPSRHWLEPPER